MSFWDLLSNEVQDYIFMFTDLDTILINEREYVIKLYRKQRKYNRLFNWSEAVKHGSVPLLKYLLTTECTVTHSDKLIEKALVQGNIDAANYIWNNRGEISTMLWKKRQRWNNRHLNKNSIEHIIECNDAKSLIAIGWILESTNEYFTGWAIDKALAKTWCSDEMTAKAWINIVEKMLSCVQRFEPRKNDSKDTALEHYAQLLHHSKDRFTTM